MKISFKTEARRRHSRGIHYFFVVKSKISSHTSKTIENSLKSENPLAPYTILIIKILSIHFRFFHKHYWPIFWPFAYLKISSKPI